MNDIVDRTILQKKSDTPPDATVVVQRPVGKVTRQASVSLGQILKQRFELVELLGSGGMGAVYKARDLRQVEAGDQSPWVALKVISEAFSRHEHALTVLQQETKKTQRLAHPNIVSVYDFDREGDIAFMTMELLEGESLDVLLARKPGGLPFEQARSIIRQICEAVDYAHRQGIVHADLKPANVFLSCDGRVKILDFGIAQAMQGDAGFDTQSLNALTPAYASVRMLTGQRPQPVDDVYALGCIFYLLLSGKHPFQRKKATEADAAGLKPARLKSLNQRQWRALCQLLAFQPASSLRIEQFQRQFLGEGEPRIRQLYQRVAIAAVLLLLVAVGTNAYLNRTVRLLAAQLVAADIATVTQAATEMSTLSGSDRVVVLDKARDDIADQLEAQLQTMQRAVDYQQLAAYLQVVAPLYPDSSRIQDAVERFRSARQRYVDALATQLQIRLSQREFTSVEPTFAEQVEDLRRVDPAHDLLQGELIKTQLAKEAGVAVYLGQKEAAQAIVAQGKSLFPEDVQRFTQIRARLQRSPPPVSPGEPISVRPVGQTLAATQELLQQFMPLSQPAQMLAFLQALAEIDPDLYTSLRQSLKEFLIEQQQSGNGKLFSGWHSELFGHTQVVATASRVRITDPCSLRLANLGKQRGYRCRDSLTASDSGPELVVVKAGNVTPFAITRTEISINDFNLYCKLYRRCVVQPPSELPVTGIELQQARFYARWLGKMTGYQYRLPTLQEWQLAGRDDSGVSDHNCLLNVSGRVVRGNQLRPVEQGYSNSLGVVNAIGNVEEWVEDGTRPLLVGGAANVPMAECGIAYRNTQNPEAGNGFRGMRLVRELNTN